MDFSIGHFSFGLLSDKGFLGSSSFSKRALRHLEKLQAKTYLIEPEYIDKSYFDEFSNYYARSFEQISSKTVRIHFFTNDFTQDYFFDNLNENRMDFFDEMNNSYLGFIIVKYLPHQYRDDKIAFGRTVLKPINVENKFGEQNILFDSVNVCLYGIKLSVNGVRYMSKDKAVGACATSALWMCMTRLNTLFSVPYESAYAITKKATKNICGNSRDFPSEGLTLEQMVGYLKLSNLDTEVFNAQNQFEEICKKNKKEYNNKLKTFISAYLTCGIPVILNICLQERSSPSAIFHHAVVVVGFKKNYNEEGNMEITIHDDKSGPYCLCCENKRVNGTRSPWHFDHYRGYQSIKVDSLIAPVTSSMRLSFTEIYEHYCIYCNQIADQNLNPSLFLIDSNSYKNEVISFSFLEPENKTNFLLKALPKYVWIFRLKHGNKVLTDHIIDSTANYCRIMQINNYM